MVTIKRGNLLEAEEKIIGHQVNCMGVAGGLAAAVFEKWPHAEDDYWTLIEKIREAGGTGWVLLGHTQLTRYQKDGHVIANIYGQLYPGEDYRPEALEEALPMLAKRARGLGWSVALPYKMSCGICGGDWPEVLRIIEDAMEGVNCVIYQREGDE